VLRCPCIDVAQLFVEPEIQDAELGRAGETLSTCIAPAPCEHGMTVLVEKRPA